MAREYRYALNWSRNCVRPSAPVDWSLAFFLKREVVALGQLHDPREEFAEASQPIGAGRRV